MSGSLTKVHNSHLKKTVRVLNILTFVVAIVLEPISFFVGGMACSDNSHALGLLCPIAMFLPVAVALTFFFISNTALAKGKETLAVVLSALPIIVGLCLWAKSHAH